MVNGECCDYVNGGLGATAAERLWDRIVTAGGEGMATRETPEGKPSAALPSVADDGYVGVLAAGGKVFALRDSEDVQ
jgi:hypothetical protein